MDKRRRGKFKNFYFNTKYLMIKIKQWRVKATPWVPRIIQSCILKLSFVEIILAHVTEIVNIRHWSRISKSDKLHIANNVENYFIFFGRFKSSGIYRRFFGRFFLILYAAYNMMHSPLFLSMYSIHCIH